MRISLLVEHDFLFRAVLRVLLYCGQYKADDEWVDTHLHARNKALWCASIDAAETVCRGSGVKHATVG